MEKDGRPEKKRQVPERVHEWAEPGSEMTVFNMNGEFNLFGKRTHLIGTIFRSYPNFKDEPVVKVVVAQKQSGGGLKNYLIGAVVTTVLAANAVVTGVLVASTVAIYALGGLAVAVSIPLIKVPGKDEKSSSVENLGDFVLGLTHGIGNGVLSGAGAYTCRILVNRIESQVGGKPTLVATNSNRLPMLTNQMVKPNKRIATPGFAIAEIILGLLLLAGGSVTTTDLLNKDKDAEGFQILDWKKIKQQSSTVPKIAWLFGQIYLNEAKDFVGTKVSEIGDNIVSSKSDKVKDSKSEENKIQAGEEKSSEENDVEISKNAERKAKKLSPEAKKGYDKAVEALKNGETKGLNDHPLKGNRNGQHALDIKGTGKGRGSGRVIYEKTNDGFRIVDILPKHNY